MNASLQLGFKENFHFSISCRPEKAGPVVNRMLGAEPKLFFFGDQAVIPNYLAARLSYFRFLCFLRYVFIRSSFQFP